ncbi:hypothetical protein JB92DRAFT_2824322 [Gautieria morchelliformis]|nr:hypothetical protein JB92DRAFT_2824322 [Gautieria morchelliformis]
MDADPSPFNSHSGSAAVKAEQQKGMVEQAKDAVKGMVDSAASTVQPESATGNTTPATPKRNCPHRSALAQFSNKSKSAALSQLRCSRAQTGDAGSQYCQPNFQEQEEEEVPSVTLKKGVLRREEAS